MKKTNPSLIGLVARRIIAFSLFAMVLQIGVVFADYWFDDDKLSVLMLQQEMATLSQAVTKHDGRLTYKPDHELRERYLERHGHAGAIYIRVRTAAGSVLFSNCTTECAEHFLPLSVNVPNFWKRVIEPG
ncbi:MAG TPA: sensor histidine kinase, partial [Sinorhizobium sp.]|nr:sensor histidine kinase [Sinorhizobium sp.]